MQIAFVNSLLLDILILAYLTEIDRIYSPFISLQNAFSERETNILNSNSAWKQQTIRATLWNVHCPFFC